MFCWNAGSAALFRRERALHKTKGNISNWLSFAPSSLLFVSVSLQFSALAQCVCICVCANSAQSTKTCSDIRLIHTASSVYTRPRGALFSDHPLRRTRWQSSPVISTWPQQCQHTQIDYAVNLSMWNSLTLGKIKNEYIHVSADHRGFLVLKQHLWLRTYNANLLDEKPFISFFSSNEWIQMNTDLSLNLCKFAIMCVCENVQNRRRMGVKVGGIPAFKSQNHPLLGTNRHKGNI